MKTLASRYNAVNGVRTCPVAKELSPQQVAKLRGTGDWPSGHVDRPWIVDGGGTNYFQGGFAMNGHFYDARTDPYGVDADHFSTDSSVPFPSLTGIFADGIWVDFWPTPTDLPAINLYNGDSFAGGGISRIAIPRHAAALGTAPKNFNPKSRLPGATGIAFADGHVQTVRLEDLWMKVVWHKNWVPPAKRPGT